MEDENEINEIMVRNIVPQAELQLRLAVLDRATATAVQTGDDPILLAQLFYGWLNSLDPEDYLDDGELDPSNADDVIFLN